MPCECPNCGCFNRPKASFCAACGQPLPAASDAASPEAAAVLNADSQNGQGIEEMLAPEDATEDGAVQEDSDRQALDESEEESHSLREADVALAEGVLIAERYVVQTCSKDEEGRSLAQVEDRTICPSCGASAAATADDPYCLQCGVKLFDASLAWPIRLLREVHSEERDTRLDGADDTEQITWGDRVFMVVADEGTAPEKQVQRLSMPTGVSLLAGWQSHVGVARAGAANEDSIFALTLGGVYEAQVGPTLGLYMVADGVGGHGDGVIASCMAAETVSQTLLQTLVLPMLQGEEHNPDRILAQIEDAILTANRRIHEHARAHGSDMGTTLTLALIVDDQVYVANAGDSRAYLWERSGLRQITSDHSHVYALYKSGLIAEEQIYTHPRRNEIFRCLGVEHTLDVDHVQETLAPGDLLLLCSDGLWEMVRNEGIADVLMLHLGDPRAICDELVKRANAAGGEDNISVVVVRLIA